MRKKQIPITIVVLFGIIFFSGCSHFSTTPIGDLLKDPRRYEGQTVAIDGKVVDSQSLFVIKYFTLEDKTGKIRVVTDRMLPDIGQSEHVRGKVNEAFSIGSARMIVLVEEPLEK